MPCKDFFCAIHKYNHFTLRKTKTLRRVDKVSLDVLVKDTARLLKHGLSDEGIRGLFKEHTLFIDAERKKPLFANELGGARSLQGRMFPEYSIIVQEIDVKTIEASDSTIKSLLREAQNTNQMIAMKMDKV